MATGDIEVRASKIEMIGRAAPVLPLEISDEKPANEETRLRTVP